MHVTKCTLYTLRNILLVSAIIVLKCDSTNSVVVNSDGLRSIPTANKKASGFYGLSALVGKTNQKCIFLPSNISVLSCWRRLFVQHISERIYIHTDTTRYAERTHERNRQRTIIENKMFNLWNIELQGFVDAVIRQQNLK